MTDEPHADAPLTHQTRRVRHETRRRLLRVVAVEDLTPRMRRFTLHSPDLADFISLGADDHVKLFLPTAGAEPQMRDYTPRLYDPRAQTLAIDFVLHDAGPATAWASQAKVGDELEIGGPRGSAIIAEDFDWILLVGDETALPAISRRLEELPQAIRAVAIIAVDNAAEQQALALRDGDAICWILRDRDGSDDAATLGAAIERLIPRGGEGFVWIAAEAGVVKALRAQVLEVHGQPLAWLKAAGYWVQGEAGH
jgi:NADPH-dependent ferric siderophore reductase